MTSSYKFTYFDVRGRGELSRYVLVIAGVGFDDHRVTREEWLDIKSSTPFGQIPVLEVDGKQLAESNTIARYLARKFDLAGKESWEQAQTDQYIELVNNMYPHVRNWVFEQDTQKKDDLLKHLEETVLPKFLTMFEKGLENNNGKYLVGDSLTVADLAVYMICDTPVQNDPTCLDKTPKLKTAREMITNIPTMKNYLQHRKRTDI